MPMCVLLLAYSLIGDHVMFMSCKRKSGRVLVSKWHSSCLRLLLWDIRPKRLIFPVRVNCRFYGECRTQTMADNTVGFEV